LRRDDGTTDCEGQDCSPWFIRDDRFKQMLHSGDTTTVDFDFEANVIVGEVGPQR
jgi:hypothetical protein